MNADVIVHAQLKVVKNGRGFIFSLDVPEYRLTCYLVPTVFLEKFQIKLGDIFAVVDYEGEVQVIKVGKFELTNKQWTELYSPENPIIDRIELIQFRVLSTLLIQRPSKKVKLDAYMDELLTREVARAITPVMAMIPDWPGRVH